MSDTGEAATLTGAQALVGTLADHGVSVCFANPGTSEMHLVTALDGEARIRSVLCLFEGVATGAADGYARITGEPAMTLLHLGPGYLNAGANIHNARKAGTPMINVIGDHAIDHQRYDAPLSSDLIGLAAPNSLWIKSADKAADAGRLAAEAWEASLGPEAGPVSLVLPADTAWTPGGAREPVRAKPAPRPVDPTTLEAVVAAVKAAAKPVALVGGGALSAEGLDQAARLQAAGVRVLTDTFVTKQARGAGRFAPARMQYFAEHALEDLKDVDLMVLIGTKTPVAFFAYPDKPNLLVPEGCEVMSLAGRDGDAAAAAKALADGLGAAPDAGEALRAHHRVPEPPSGALTPGGVAQSLARHMPENAIVSDDGVTGSIACFMATAEAAPHDWLMLTGGAIGQGLPLAVGTAVAAPGRRTIALSGDGAGLYTVQALWTMARENLPVTVVVFVNHSYRILNIELYRTGAGQPGPAAQGMLDLGRPEIDWVKLSEGLGVPAVACSTGEAFDAALAEALAADGPRLIAALEG